MAISKHGQAIESKPLCLGKNTSVGGVTVKHQLDFGKNMENGAEEIQKLCRVLGKLIPSRLWLNRFPKLSTSSLLGNSTPSRLWLYQKPKVMLRRLSGNFTFCKPWLNSCPNVKVSWWLCSPSEQKIFVTWDHCTCLYPCFQMISGILGVTKWNKQATKKTSLTFRRPRFKTFWQDHILQPLIPGIRQGQGFNAAGQGDALQALFEPHSEDQILKTLR